MNYSIKVNKLEKENWSTKAFVSVVFEESLKVTDITIRETKKEKYLWQCRDTKQVKRMNRVILSTKIIFIYEDIGMSKKVDIYIILRFYTFIYCATNIIIKYNDL